MRIGGHSCRFVSWRRFLFEAVASPENGDVGEITARLGLQIFTSLPPIPAFRYVASSTKSALGSIYLKCHVKPGASKQREGIISISNTVVEICVSARAREDEANKAVVEVVSKALNCPKSGVTIVRGLKSRDKTVAIAGFDINGNEENSILRVRKQLDGIIE